jgi:heme A synthase
MKATKTAGLGLGALGASALASCHLVQAVVLGMLGMLGTMPFIRHHPAPLVLVVIGCGAVILYGVSRLLRSRRAHRGMETAPMRSN